MPYGIRPKLAAFGLTQRRTEDAVELGITHDAGMICSHWLSQVFECPAGRVLDGVGLTPVASESIRHCNVQRCSE